MSNSPRRLSKDPRVFEVRSERGRRKMERIFLRSVEQSNPTAVALCLEKGVYPNIFNEDDMAPIHIIAEKGDMVVGQELLAHPQIKRRNVVKALLNKGADPNILNPKGQSALHMSCVTENRGIITDLTGGGAQVNVIDVFDNTPLSIAAIESASEPVVRHLLRKGASITLKQFPLFLESVLHCNSPERLRILKILLIHRGDVINALHPVSKMNCLHYAAIGGYVPAAELLLTCGANLNHVDLSKRTPLEMAKDHDNKELVKLFTKWSERTSVALTSEESALRDVHKLSVAFTSEESALRDVHKLYE